MSLKQHKGAAIIVALFVVSLVAIAAVAMLERLRIDMRRTELTQHATVGNLYAIGSIAWAMETLNDNLKKQKTDKRIDATPITSPKNEVDQAEIQSTIYGAEGFFNLNNLNDPNNLEDFRRLLLAVLPTLPGDTTKDIANAIQHWISGANNMVLEEYYTKQSPPYRAPHRLMVSVSELRLVKGVTPDIYNALLPYIIALPETTKININDAEAPVLMSLSKTLSRESADNLVKARKQNPLSDIAKNDIVKNNRLPEDKITPNSNYFLVKTNVKVQDQQTVLYTLIHREMTNSKPKETVLWQSKGTL